MIRVKRETVMKRKEFVLHSFCCCLLSSYKGYGWGRWSYDLEICICVDFNFPHFRPLGKAVS